MIKDLREEFNSKFHERSYHSFLKRLDYRFRSEIFFRVAETPVFIPNNFRKICENAAIDISMQAHNHDYLKETNNIIPSKYLTINQKERSQFITVDFAVTLENGVATPKLVELQGFPSLMGYQLALAELSLEHYRLPTNLSYINSDLNRVEYIDLLRKVIVNDEAPESVALMELDPFHQKTLPDFMMIKELLGIGIADVRYIKSHGKELFYESNGELHPIKRIFNRVIFDELERKNIKTNINWNEDLDIEWISNPNWFYRISKFTIPFLKHSTVPETILLNKIDFLPKDLENYVLKPLFSFSGNGVILSPNSKDINNILHKEKQNYILQRRIDYASIIDTPVGDTKLEYRIMLVWPDDEVKPIPIMGLARLGRGPMMGVDHNANMTWIGSSCALYG
ncbi:MAG: hypothetical protein IPP08_11495 [Chlorobiota bacterium]|nr:hypothetical protein [Chlorobiota bacterium]QQS66369.1 MAG: hypothetical protein IPP08_11495 [Chlorobiota bacterium]